MDAYRDIHKYFNQSAYYYNITIISRTKKIKTKIKIITEAS